MKLSSLAVLIGTFSLFTATTHATFKAEIVTDFPLTSGAKITNMHAGTATEHKGVVVQSNGSVQLTVHDVMASAHLAVGDYSTTTEAASRVPGSRSLRASSNVVSSVSMDSLEYVSCGFIRNSKDGRYYPYTTVIAARNPSECDSMDMCAGYWWNSDYADCITNSYGGEEAQWASQSSAGMYSSNYRNVYHCFQNGSSPIVSVYFDEDDTTCYPAYARK